MLIGNKYSGYSRANIRLYFDPVTIMAAGTAEVAAITAAEIAAAEAIAAATAEAAMIASAEAAALQATQAAAATAAETGAITAAEAGAIQANNIAAGQAVAADAATQAGIMQVGGPTAAQAPLTTTAEVNAAATRGSIPEVVSRRVPVPSPAATSAVPSASSTVPQSANFFSSPSTAPGPGPLEYQLNAPPDTMQGLRLGTGTEGLTMPNTPATSVSQLPTAQPPSSLMKGLNSAMDWAKANKFETAVGTYAGASALGLLDPSQQTFNDDPYDGPLSKYRMSPDFQGRTATPNIYQPTYPTYAAGGIMNAGPVQSMSDQNNAMGYQQAMAATGGQVANFAKGGKTGSLTDSLDYYKEMMGGKTPAAPSERTDVGIFRDSDPDTMYQDALTAAQIRAAKVNKRANLSVPSMKRPTPMGQINLAAPGIKSLNKEDAQEAAGGGLMSLAQGGSINLQGSFDMGGGQGGNQTGNLNNPQSFVGSNNAPSMMPQQGVTPLPSPTQGLNKSSYLPTDMESIRQSMLNTRGLQELTKGPMSQGMAFAEGGLSSLGGYAAGGNPRLLRGPGDGMSDNIPAMIGKKQPARLADGEFVIPADVVSHLGNGSTEAGANRLHEMMNKVRRDRTGNSKQGKQIVAAKYMPK